MENKTDNKKRTDAQKRADAKYYQKTKRFLIKYTPTDIKEANRLENYLKTINLSTNAYLKSLVKKDLDEKGILYDNNEN